MNSEPKQYTLLRKLLKALGLSDQRIEELITTIQGWLAEDKEEPGKLHFPYKLRDDFLSPAELNFYRVLVSVANDWTVLCTKVNLADLFYPQTGDHGQNQTYRNKIDRKHVDFLLCDPATMRPLLGIELDDSSHNRSDRQTRDKFVDGVFAAAGLSLLHIPVTQNYSLPKIRAMVRSKAGLADEGQVSNPQSAPQTEVTEIATKKAGGTAVPSCPQCNAPMVLRTAQKGSNAGKSFWGCSHYPDCRGIRQLT